MNILRIIGGGSGRALTQVKPAARAPSTIAGVLLGLAVALAAAWARSLIDWDGNHAAHRLKIRDTPW